MAKVATVLGQMRRTLPTPATLGAFHRSGDGNRVGIPHQPARSGCPSNRQPLPGTLADRDLFQVDQTTPEDQDLSRHIRKCGAGTDLDRDDRLSAGTNSPAESTEKHHYGSLPDEFHRHSYPNRNPAKPRLARLSKKKRNRKTLKYNLSRNQRELTGQF